ncbi:recombinase family protein [Glycocaulis profundi]|nr:recombinase family protein [Glycocaulis profundi]
MTAAIYARYSSDLQSASSLDDQIRKAQALCAREGLGPAQVFVDAGISGASMANRPGLKEMLAAVDAGRVSAVVTEALDRLSRDQADIALIHRRLKTRGVRLLTVSEGEIGTDASGLLHVGMRGVINALYLADLAAKTHRGLEGVVRSGRHAGPPPYGYRLKAGGEPGELEIDEAAADIVRRIWREYAAGRSARQIAKTLNAEGVPGPRGAPWRQTAIAGQAARLNGIIRNPLYTGTAIWNRNRKVKDPETGRARMVARPESEWIREPRPALRIIDPALQAAVQAETARRAQGRPEQQRRRSRPLSGLLRCGSCGGTMTLIGGQQRRYACADHRDTGRCGNGRTFRADEIERRVLSAMKARLLDPEGVRLAVAAYREERERLAAEGRAGRDRLERKIEELRGAEARIIAAIERGVASDAMMDRIPALERERKALQAELGTMDGPAPTALHPNAADAYAGVIARLEHALAGELPELAEDPARLAEAVTAARRLFTAITVSRNEKSGETDLLVEGDLAALIMTPLAGVSNVGCGGRI